MAPFLSHTNFLFSFVTPLTTHSNLLPLFYKDLYEYWAHLDNPGSSHFKILKITLQGPTAT